MSASGDSSEFTSPLTGMARSVLDALSAGAVVFDDEFRVLHRNAPAARLFADGSSAVEVLGASFARSPVSDWEAELHRVIQTGQSRRYGAMARTGESAKDVHVRLTVTPMTAAGAQFGGGVIIAEPVTDAVRPGEPSNADPRDDITARVAHELNNPLDGVLRYVSLAIGKLQADESPEATACLEQARDGLHRMARIVREVLGFARGNARTAPPVAINHAVEEAVRSFEDRAAGQGVVITASLRNEHMPAVRGHMLGQVCGNIVANALDAMPDGGMLTVSTGVTDGVVMLRFEDTGSGLPDDADRIWDPFFTTKTEAKGTGLGLAICKDFMERLGGSIAAERRGGGTAFIVRLPVERCVSRDEATSAAPRGE